MKEKIIMTEAKWISLDDRTKTVITSAVNLFCTNEMLNNSQPIIGIRIDKRSVAPITKKLSKLLDIADSDESGVIKIHANEKFISILPYIQATKPSRLFKTGSSNLDNTAYCKRVSLFMKGKLAPDKENKVFGNYDMDRFILENYSNTPEMVYIYNNLIDFDISVSSHNNRKYIMAKELSAKMITTAKNHDVIRAERDTKNMEEYLRQNGIGHADLLSSILGTDRASTLIDETSIDKKVMSAVNTLERIQKELIVLNYTKLKVKELGGTKGVLKSFRSACEQMVDEEYNAL